jgi:hypothetical protein
MTFHTVQYINLVVLGQSYTSTGVLAIKILSFQQLIIQCNELAIIYFKL